MLNIQPRAEPRAGSKPLAAKRIVDDVLGQRGIAHQTFGHAQKTRTFLHIQILQGLTLATRAGGQTGFVIEKRFGQGHCAQPVALEMLKGI